MTLLNTLASNASKPEDPVKGALAKPVIVSGKTVVPAGAQILGSVLETSEAGRVKGRASIVFRFERLVVGGETYRIQTARLTREAAADTKSDVKKGARWRRGGRGRWRSRRRWQGGGIGAVAGGAGTVLATKGKEIELPAGTPLTALLQQPITVTVPR